MWECDGPAADNRASRVVPRLLAKAFREDRTMMMKTSTLVATALVSATLGIRGSIAHAGNPCAATAKAANEACRNEKTDEYFIAVGNCLNLSTLDATKACKKSAKQDLADAKVECTDQRDARLALCDQLGKAPYDPPISQADFLSPAETAANPNPYFPLVPGDVWVYQGGGEIDTVTVTDKTRVIDGVTTIVVHDVVTDMNHVPKEVTDDFFAQKKDGTVMYFGEASQELNADGDVVDVEGSFKAGVDGAKPGIIMKASSAVGDVYRQEFALGDAEDAAEVISTTGSETVPGATCAGTCVVTHEFSPLEPDANEQKFYAPGIGVILEVDIAAGGTRLELLSFTHP